MNKIEQFIVGVLVGAGLTMGVIAVLPQPVVVPTQQVAGASAGPDHYNTENFYNGLTYSTITGMGSSSSSTPTTTLASNASVGHLTLGTGQTAEYASTTAITSANAKVVVQLEQSTPLAGVTCNTNLTASATEATTVYFASSTNPSLNGFKISVANAPVTNPFCFAYGINGD